MNSRLIVLLAWQGGKGEAGECVDENDDSSIYSDVDDDDDLYCFDDL